VAPTVRAERWFVLTGLLTLAGVGWALVAWQAAGMDVTRGRLDLTMGMAAPLFIAMWTAMMVAMMFPASAPMVLAYARTQAGKRADGRPYVPTAFFLAPYVAVWTIFGMVGFVVARAVAAVAGDSMWAMDNLPRIAGALLVGAGVYQLTPLKRVCLARCRTPLSFMLSYWREGRRGAMSMGLRHGLYCLGCCWVLFVVLFSLGVMNAVAMLAVTALIFAEKVLPRGELVARAAAVMLVAYGVVAILVPRALPTVM
jgi:predicted metal-binding membrane protein